MKGRSVNYLLLFAIFSWPIFIASFTRNNAKVSPQVELLEKVNVTVPSQAGLQDGQHVFQTFNNCGPASLSMALSHFGINESQGKLGQILRPYQNKFGDNDDKSVTLSEMEALASEYGLLAYHRPNGNIETLKRFIAQGVPVITRTWLEPNSDIGHYRVITGYDDGRRIIIQDDSLQGKSIEFDYAEFDELWRKFNYEYLVLVPQEKKQEAESIIGQDIDKLAAWGKAVELAQNELEENENDIYSRFNLSVAYYNIGEYQKSVEEFEKVENLLPFRTLWYQIEPILAYQKLGNFEKVFSITDKILNNDNRAFSELYQIRGELLFKRGEENAAREEFRLALVYNENFEPAIQALSKI